MYIYIVIDIRIGILCIYIYGQRLNKKRTHKRRKQTKKGEEGEEGILRHNEERRHSEHIFFQFWGLDVGAIKSSIAKSWQAKKLVIIASWFINDMLTLC